MATATGAGLRLSLCRSASVCGSAVCNSQTFIHSEATRRASHGNPALSAVQRERIPNLSSQFLPSMSIALVRDSPSLMGKENAVRLGRKQQIHSALVGTETRNDADASEAVPDSPASGISQKFRMDAKTGAFQHLPVVSPADEILGTGLRRAKMVRPTKGIINVAKRERNRGAKQLDALIKELALPLKTYVQKFPRLQQLHAYESAVLELTLGEGQYDKVLEKVDLFRKRLLDTGKNLASICAKSTTKREAQERLAEGFTRLEELFKNHGIAVDNLKEHAKKLRAMPVISLRTPTLCLVGAPNVGKSSLVRILSSGKPEVCNYQFTTRGISIGHFEIDSRRFQVTDTPGLLERPDEERNNMEKLTLAALSHLPTSILYVHDLTEECGSSALKQYKIYSEMKRRYSDRPWMDVVSKADLLPAVGPNRSCFDPHSFDAYKQLGPSGALRVSIQTGEGVDELVRKVHTLLSSAHPDETKDEQSTWGGERDGDVTALQPVEEYYYPAWPRKQEN